MTLFLQQAVPLASATAPAEFLALDIETGFAPDDYIEHRLRAWKPTWNTKPENVATKRAEATDKMREKSALLDGAPILCVALIAAAEKVIFHSMGDDDYSIPGWSTRSHACMKGMLNDLRQWLDAHTDRATVLVGHNILSFDLPKLRHAFIVSRLRLPEVLMPPLTGDAQPVQDTMRMWRFFTSESDSEYVGMAAVAEQFGVPTSKQIVSGAEIPQLHRDGRIAEILTYCATDTAAELLIWKLMTGKITG